MHRFIAAMVLFLALAGSSINAATAKQDDATATSSPPADELCDMDFDTGEIEFGGATEAAEVISSEAGIVVVPPGEAGIVTPANAPTLSLYPVVITMPPGSCVPFHEIAGAAVLFVQEGAIVYVMHSDALPAPEVQTGHLNIRDTFRVVDSGTWIRLEPGGWVTQEQRVWFSYRNFSYVDAVITMAALVDPEGLEPETDPVGGIGGCNGGCRKR